MGTTTPAYLLSTHPGCREFERGTGALCTGVCGQLVKQNSATGRWFITMYHAGFNSPANNGRGYATMDAAAAASRRYSARGAQTRAANAGALATDATTTGTTDTRTYRQIMRDAATPEQWAAFLADERRAYANREYAAALHHRCAAAIEAARRNGRNVDAHGIARRARS